MIHPARFRRMAAALSLLACLALGPALAAGTDATPGAPPDAPAAEGGPPGPLQAPPRTPPRTSQLTLANGLRVVIVEHHRRPIVAIRLVLPRGTLGEAPASAGATNLAVELATDFYEREDATDDQDGNAGEKSFRYQIAEMGGTASAEAGPDHAVFSISGYASDAGRYLKMLGEAVRRPRHSRSVFAARRDQVLDRIEDLESTDPEALSQLVAAAAFGRGHPYARPVIGTHAVVEEMGLEDVIAEQRRLLVPGGATLVVVGDVRPEQAARDAAAAFGRWLGRAEPPPDLSLAPAVEARGREVGLLRRQPATTLVVCASRPLSGVTASDATLQVLAALLGQGGRSRLMMALREERGLTYGAEAMLVRRRQARAFLACSSIDGASSEQGLRVFRETLEAARAQPPSPAELQRARALLLAELDAAHDDALASAATWVRALALGHDGPRLDAERAELERVTAQQVQAAARAVLAPASLRWIVSGDPAVAALAVSTNHLGTLAAFTLDH